MYQSSLALLLVILSLVACEDASVLTPYSYTQLAMSEGMQIQAKNKNGTVTIDYISPLERRYRWAEFDEIRHLIPRKENWRGRLGAYNPASKFFWELWKPTPRIVTNDSQLHFKSMEEIESFLLQGSDYFDWVYTETGLVVGFGLDLTRDQINIDVYQIFLRGKIPKGLIGSNSERITINEIRLNQ